MTDYTKKPIMLTMILEDAKEISLGMSDLLCWCRGFRAANGNYDNGPTGDDEVRQMRVKLLEAIRQTEEQPF